MLRSLVDRRGELVRYAGSILGEPALAEDVVQDAYLRLERAGKATADDGTGAASVGYLLRIVRNLAIDVRRRTTREHRRSVCTTTLAVQRTAADRPSPEDEALSREELRVLAAAMVELPERTRVALEMHRVRGCKLKEIAAELGISVTTAHELVAQGVDHCRRRVAAAS